MHGDSDSPATPGDLPARYEEEIAGIKAVIAANRSAGAGALGSAAALCGSNESAPEHGEESGHSGGEATRGGENHAANDASSEPEPADPQKPASEPLGIEKPCATNGRAVRRDLRAIARMLNGVVVGAQTGKRFPGGQIDPGRQSFDNVVNTLKRNGFVFNHSLDHPEGESYQKKFSDGFWYHAVVNYPKDAQFDAFTGALSNPQSPTPLVTAHCHSTDPEGWAHIKETILGP